jgi:hypothetical protein
MTLLVRDEADIVASNIDFHLARGVDFVVATDNLSVDGTTEILREYERRGVLHYIHEPNDDYSQYRWVTRMARLAHTEFGADWVMNNDADEFWWPECGDLKAALASVPASRDAVVAERSNFPARPASDAPFYQTMVLRDRESKNMRGVRLRGKVAHRGFDDIQVGQGNHAVRRSGDPLPTAPVPIEILHFPQRSYEQFANKVVLGGRAYARNDVLPPNVGLMWRTLYESWQRGELEALYHANVVDEATAQRRLADGSLILDERLRDALR